MTQTLGHNSLNINLKINRNPNLILNKFKITKLNLPIIKSKEMSFKNKNKLKLFIDPHLYNNFHNLTLNKNLNSRVSLFNK